MQPQLAGLVGGGLGDFAADIRIRAQRGRLGQESLTASGAPGDTPDSLWTAIHPHRFPLETRPEPVGDRIRADRRIELAVPEQPRDAAGGHRLVRGNAELFHQTGVVAAVLIHIQRQMIGEQIDVVAQQQAQSFGLHPGDHRRFALPEKTMMHQHGIRLGLQRCLEQPRRGGHTRDQAPDVIAPLDLKAVGAVIAHAGHIEPIGKIILQFATVYHIGLPH
jgi:hypothetical protein